MSDFLKKIKEKKKLLVVLIIVCVFVVLALLRTFVFSRDKDILDLFDNNEYLKNTIERDSTKNTDEALIEIYEKLRPGEPATLDSSKNQLITRFFDRFRYDLAKVGRYKFNKKLNVLDRLLGQKIAQDIKDGNEVIVSDGTVITREILDKIRPLFENGYGLHEVMINEELDEYKKALYRYMRSHVKKYMLEREIVKTIDSMDDGLSIIRNNPSSYYGLVDSKLRDLNVDRRILKLEKKY